MLEKTLESLLDFKVIKSINPKENQSWIFTGSTDTKVETPILWKSDAKRLLPWKDPNAGKDWGQEEGQRLRRLDGIIDSMDMSLSKVWEIVKDREAWQAAVQEVTKSRTWWAAEQQQF